VPARWIRILVVGLIAGIAWYVSSSLLLSLFARPFLAWATLTGSTVRWSGGVFFAIDLLMGVWVVGLYAALSAGERNRTLAAAGASLAWWSMKTLQSAKWAGLGLIPRQVILAPLLTSLLATIVATGVGVWLFEGRLPWQRARSPVSDANVR
jgi:hypothetical protein